MKHSRLLAIIILFISCIGLSQTAYSAFKTGRIGGAKNLVATPVVDLITALNAKLGQVQISQLLSVPGQWLANSDIEDLNLNFESFGGFPLDRHELAFLTHSLATVLSDNTTTLGNSQASLQNLINSSVTNGLCNGSNCSETSADWVHGQVSDENFANTDNVNLITASLLDDLMSGDSSHVDGYTSIVLGANSSVGIQDLRDDGFFRSISNPTGNQPPPATEVRNAINYIAGFVQPATVGAPTPAEYTAGQTLVDNFLNNNDRGNFTLANFISCFNNNEAARSGGQGTCNVSASDWDQQVTALANFNYAKSRLAGGTALTIADLQSIPVTFGNLTAPIQEWHADYISSQLGTGDAVSLTNWQNTINNINEGVAARWKIQQVADNATGHEPSDVTNHLLLRATDGTFDAATALGAGVSKTAAGFGGSTNISGLTSTSTPAQIQTAVLSYIGFTDPIYAAWNGNSDRANFSLADFTNCYNDNDNSRSGGSSVCSVTSSQWATNSSVLSYFAQAKTDITNGVILSQSDFENIGLNLSNVSPPLTMLVRQYLSATLDSNASEISDWQTTINNFNNQTASLWKIAQVAAGSNGHEDSDITANLLNDGIGNNFNVNNALSSVSTASLNGFVASSNFDNLVSPNNTSTGVETALSNYLGFNPLSRSRTAGTTTESITELREYLANTDRSNFTIESFRECFESSATATGGQYTCNVTSVAWNDSRIPTVSFSNPITTVHLNTDSNISDLRFTASNDDGSTVAICYRTLNGTSRNDGHPWRPEPKSRNSGWFGNLHLRKKGRYDETCINNSGGIADVTLNQPVSFNVEATSSRNLSGNGCGGSIVDSSKVVRHTFQYTFYSRQWTPGTGGNATTWASCNASSITRGRYNGFDNVYATVYQEAPTSWENYRSRCEGYGQKALDLRDGDSMPDWFTSNNWVFIRDPFTISIDGSFIGTGAVHNQNPPQDRKCYVVGRSASGYGFYAGTVYSQGSGHGVRSNSSSANATSMSWCSGGHGPSEVNGRGMVCYSGFEDGVITNDTFTQSLDQCVKQDNTTGC